VTLERGADAGARLTAVRRNATTRRNSAWSVSNKRLVAGSRPRIIPQFRRLNRHGERIVMPLRADEANQLNQNGNGQQLYRCSLHDIAPDAGRPQTWTARHDFLLLRDNAFQAWSSD
jgi:hypothetical protein